MRLPTLHSLKEDQIDVLEQPVDSSILVVGPPGSGKTSIALWRAKLLISPEYQRSVVFVTRNRLLTAVAGRLAAENDANIQALTMHTFFPQDYYRRFGSYAPQWEPYAYDWRSILKKYEDAGVQPSLDHLIIDEGQNLPIEFIEWGVRFGARVVSLFADEKQATLGEGSSVAQYGNLGFHNVFALKMNHRSSQEIVDFVEYFHINRVIPRAESQRGGGFDRPRSLTVQTWDSFADAVAARYVNRAEAVGVIFHRQQEAIHFAGLLRECLGKTRVDFYTSSTPVGQEHAIQMRENGVSVICGESAIGLEFDTLFLHDLSRSLPLREDIDYRRLYMLSARARDMLILVNGPEMLTPEQWASLPEPPLLERE